MIRHFFTLQFVWFLGVGGLAALLHWTSRVILSLWMPFPVAVFIAYGFGMTFAFILNRIFIFPNSNRLIRKQVRDFVLTNIAFLPVVWLASIQMNYWLLSMGMTKFTEEISHAFAIALPMMATFLIYKFFTFKTE